MQFAPAQKRATLRQPPAAGRDFARPQPRPAAGLPRFLQAKLAVGPVDDPLEHEADATAERVMRMPEPTAATRPGAPVLRRKCAACEGEDKEKLHMKAAGSAGPETAPPIVHDVLRAPGEPLDPETRAFMEPRFGEDFSGVRVHTDRRAAASADSIGASAYTAGRNIAFARGQYDAATTAGRRLLAHELVHVVQQQPGRISRQPQPAPGSPGAAPAPSPATPIMGTALARQLRSVSLTKTSSPQVARQAGSPGTIDLVQTRLLTFNAVARFAPGPALSGWKFGFFQLERPFEDYQVTLHESGATGPNKDINLYLNDTIRAQLPLLDHPSGSVFFQPRGLPATATADPSGEVKLTYNDFWTTPFATSIQKAGTFYTLSGVSTRAFFFTAFGATDGTSTVLLATFFWDVGGCDAITPADISATKVIGNVNVAPVRLCNGGSCDAAEGAALFGTVPSKTALDVSFAEIRGKFQDPGKYQGPANYQLACAAARTPSAAGK